MKALILKDIYCAIKLYGFFLLAAVFMSVSGNAYIVLLVAFYGATISSGTLYSDEKSKWNKLAGMMPYKKSDIILSKYILSYLSIAVFLVIAITTNFLTYTFNFTSSFNIDAYALSLAYGLIYTAITMFTMLTFGVAKSRLIVVLAGIIIVLLSLLGSGSGLLSDVSFAGMISPQIILSIAVLLNAIAIFVQIKFIPLN